jgi:aconitate hydratase
MCRACGPPCLGDTEELPSVLLKNGSEIPIKLLLPGLSREERDIILVACLINSYR